MQSSPIEGLHWTRNFEIANGEDSRVIPFPTTSPIHIVFHGDTTFSHGHFGYHTGLIDRLTFLGPKEQVCRGHFRDCRLDSPTLGAEWHEDFYPNPSRMLVIPNGVAHHFEGLENVFTINSYEVMMPPPEVLVTDQNPWKTGADIVNFPIDAPDSEIPWVTPNKFKASKNFYRILRDYQRKTLRDNAYEYPITRDFNTLDQGVVRLALRQPIEAHLLPAKWEAIDEIEGLGWHAHYLVLGNDGTGYAALLDPSPMQVIDHGSKPYTHDAYGIHLESEDRLTFVGSLTKEIIGNFIDCRDGSPTWGRETTVTFSPNPKRYLTIPAGVAHAFDGLEDVWTINRPVRCAGDLSIMEPGNDIIDWPVNRRPFPSFNINLVDVDDRYYEMLADLQRQYLLNPTDSSTAMSFLMNNNGEDFKVLVRKS